jgi:hypothetical protein
MKKLEKFKSLELQSSETKKIIIGGYIEGMTPYTCYYRPLDGGKVVARTFSDQNGTDCPHQIGYFRCDINGNQI